MTRQWIILSVCCFTVLLGACSPKNRQTSDEVIKNAAQEETTSAGASVEMMEEERKELSKYQGVTDNSVLTGFYNLDCEEETSALSRNMAQGFPKTGRFQYFYTENDVIILGAVELKDGLYYELLYNTSDGSSSIYSYTALRMEESEELGTDNIRRRQVLYFLENKDVSKYIGKDVRNLTESEVIDAFKQYKGIVNQSEYTAWKNPNEVLEQNYSSQNGLMTDLKYTAEADETLYLCGVNVAPDGYCLTVYDPAKDWFEVYGFSNMYCVLASDGTKEYYLSNLLQEHDYKKNTILDIQSDGYLYIAN